MERFEAGRIARLTRSGAKPGIQSSAGEKVAGRGSMELFRAGDIGLWEAYKVAESGFEVRPLRITIGGLVLPTMRGAG
jgi:hypothetical protein